MTIYSLDIFLSQFWTSCFFNCIQVSQEAGKVVWYSHLLKNFPQFVVIHTVKSFLVVTEAAVFLEFPIFLWSSGCWQFDLWFLWLFLNPACTSGSSQFKCRWSLAGRILTITLLACEMSTIVFEHYLALPFFGAAMKTDLYQSTAEFARFAGILSAALSQHHLLGFEIAQLEFHHLH